MKSLRCGRGRSSRRRRRHAVRRHRASSTGGHALATQRIEIAGHIAEEAALVGIAGLRSHGEEAEEREQDEQELHVSAGWLVG